MESVIKTLQHQRLVQRFSTLLEKPTFNNKDSRIEKQNNIYLSLLPFGRPTIAVPHIYYVKNCTKLGIGKNMV